MSKTNFLKQVFSVSNDFINGRKYKIVNVAGIKIKHKIGEKKEIKYTTIHYLLAILKAYGIEYYVTSPGTQNANFNYLLQNDKELKTFSVIDERSAAYVATGLAYETNKPVVITCTGATASRNYLSALTEAHNRHLPIIAITFFNYDNNPYNLAPQFVDRSISQNDIKAISVELPNINTRSDRIRCITLINAALTTAINENKPVHINCPGNLDFSIKSSSELPKNIWATKTYRYDFKEVIKEIENKRTAIFIGSHRIFTEEAKSISNFVEKFKIPVFCDHTSNYHGANKILTQQISHQKAELLPEIVIDIGDITGDYSSSSILYKAKFWRISEDTKFKNRYGFPVTKFFACSEKYFFESFFDENINFDKQEEFLMYIKEKANKYEYPDVPFSNSFVCRQLVKYLPKNSSLHCAILNSLRNMGYYNLDESIDVICNVGGFGIDGGVSTLVGQSFANPNKKCFGLFGDLAFFYDMNILGNRDIKNNLRILMVNNYKGVEFRLNQALEKPLGAEVDKLIAAAEHNLGGAKGWAESCKFEYMSAKNEEEFLNKINDFCNKDYEKPVFFEVFTQNDDEKEAINLMRTHNKNK